MDSVPSYLASRPLPAQQHGNDNQEVGQNSYTRSLLGKTTQRSNGKLIADSKPMHEDVKPEEKSLMEKLRDHYHKRPTSDNKTRILARVWFQFQGITQFYMTMVYLVPYILADFSDMTQYYFKICVCYMFVMTQANWLCSICYSSYLPDMRDRPDVESNNWLEHPPNTFQGNGHALRLDTSDKNGLRWQFCDVCERYRPPRAHHCNFCKTCILRRDHHCYLVGNCIGHYNQRYFIVLCFLTMWVCAIGFPLTVYYLSSLEGATWWAHYALPYTLIHFLYGEVSWQFLILTFHSHMLFVFGFVSCFYFLSQISIVAMGKTLYEVAKKVDMRVTSSTSENFRLVFGDYWLINFLFPAQIIFKQRHDGIRYDDVKLFEYSEDKK